MSKELFKSERPFSFWAYCVSHGQLLLRSDKRKGYSENIDIVFFGTEYFQIFCNFDGISIKIITGEISLSYSSANKYLNYPNHNLFELESRDEKYYIMAAHCKIYENKLEWNETNLSYKNDGEQKEIGRSF